MDTRPPKPPYRAPTDLILKYLYLRPGIVANYDFGPSPTEIVASHTADPTRLVMACRDFNRPDGGWEAVMETPDKTTPLEDGPGPTAYAVDVAEWIHALLVKPDEEPRT